MTSTAASAPPDMSGKKRQESRYVTGSGRSATINSEQERFDGRRSQFDPLQTLGYGKSDTKTTHCRPR
jgi:hypothetical protein